MELPLSQLIYARFREPSSPRRVITLHRHNAFLEGMGDLGLAVNPNGVVLGLQASKGVYLGRSVVGYTWFVGPQDRPSPVHFGDAMGEIERFLWDEIDRQRTDAPVLPFLVGEEQGATMALAMAAAAPDLLSGVVAVDASLPIVPGWDPPLAPLDGLPILLVNPRSGDTLSANVLGDSTLATTFEGWGAAVDVLNHVSEPVPTVQIAAYIKRQPIRTLKR
jgi:pimeloyl-ACP methyl ester carboxylesterase